MLPKVATPTIPILPLNNANPSTSRGTSGDTLLINGTGRTDFQNGDAKDAYNSIFNKLLKLPEETLLYPAHDYKGEKVSTIGKEKKQNPRLQVNSVNEYVEIMNNLNLKKPTEIDNNIAKNIRLGA